MTPNTVRNHFFSVLKMAENNISNFVNKPGSDMTRHRKCAFMDTITATLCFSMNRTNTELFHFFGIRNKDHIYRIKQARSDNYYYQMHLNALYDICENRYVTAITQPRPTMNESQALCQMIDQCSMPDNTILIADRGYLNANTIAHLLDANKYFLIRVKAPSSGFLMHIMEENKETDFVIYLGVTRSRKKKYTHNPSKYKIIRPDRVFEPIPAGDI